MRTTTSRWPLWVCPCLLILGCVHYEPQPLDPAQILAQEDALRALALPDADQADLNQLALRLEERSPRLRRARAAYERAAARAGQPNPWPNPTLAIGPSLASGRDIVGLPLAPMGSLGLKIPLGDRLESLDLIDELTAKRAELEYQLIEQDSILELRRRFESLAVATKNFQLSRRLNEDIRHYVELTNRRIEAGQSSARDLSLYLLEQGRADLQLMESEAELENARSRLAQLVGINWTLIGSMDHAAVPDLVDFDWPRADLLQVLIHRQPELARKRADYDLAEAQLRLEVAQQYPDLEIGFSGADEPGEEKQTFGLTLGIELPLFDRNQKAIALAEAARFAAREDFSAAVATALSELDEGILAIRQAEARYRLLSNSLLPNALQHLGTIRASVQAGSLDPLNILDAERLHRQLQLDQIAAEHALRSAWADLEQSLGSRLRAFPNDTTTTPTTISGESQP